MLSSGPTIPYVWGKALPYTPSALRIIRFPVWPVGPGTTSSPGYGTNTCKPLGWFFPGPWLIDSRHVLITGEDSGAPVQISGVASVQLSFLRACPGDCSHVGIPGLSARPLKRGFGAPPAFPLPALQGLSGAVVRLPTCFLSLRGPCPSVPDSIK